MAENLWIDEVMWAAGREHLKKIGQIPAVEPGEPRGPKRRRVRTRRNRRAQASRPNGCPSEAPGAQPRRRVEAVGFLFFSLVTY
jgi:hypothetical protein